MSGLNLPGPGLWTTSVGSLPKPDDVIKARSRFARKEIDRTELRELEERATKEWIDFQESIGTDLTEATWSRYSPRRCPGSRSAG
jgi:methionine synthase II (cobalamin-independent)